MSVNWPRRRLIQPSRSCAVAISRPRLKVAACQEGSEFSNPVELAGYRTCRGDHSKLRERRFVECTGIRLGHPVRPCTDSCRILGLASSRRTLRALSDVHDLQRTRCLHSARGAECACVVSRRNDDLARGLRDFQSSCVNRCSPLSASCPACQTRAGSDNRLPCTGNSSPSSTHARRRPTMGRSRPTIRTRTRPC